jgi:hypothetical protein
MTTSTTQVLPEAVVRGSRRRHLSLQPLPRWGIQVPVPVRMQLARKLP